MNSHALLLQQSGLASQELLWKVVTSLGESLFIVDNHDTIVNCNPAVESMFGYSPKELIGKGVIQAHVSEASFHDFKTQLAQAAANGDCLYLPEFSMRRKNGDVFYSEHSTVVLRTPEGHPAGRVSIVRDISHRKQTERRVREALQQKEMLLKEIHHRVKNNLQIVSSLITLAEQALDESHQRQVLKETSSRIQAIALVHEHVYATPNLSRIDLARYLLSHQPPPTAIYTNKPVEFQFRVEGDSAELNARTLTTLGLIATEVIGNSIKHAFHGRSHGTVLARISTREEGFCLLTLLDDGTGFNPADLPNHGRGLGLDLISLLSSHIGGTATPVQEGPYFGWTLRFPIDNISS